MGGSGTDKHRIGDKYRFIAEVGHGGMADIFLAVTEGSIGGFKKLVVVKVLRTSLTQEEDFLKMFLDEARLAARLNHANIVQTNEVGEYGGRYFMVMEYLEGQTYHRVTRVPEFVLSMRLHVLTRVLAGLQYAHELTDYDGQPLQVVHRDVSPSNILLAYDGQVKLLDFGIAKALDSTHETRAGVVKGKVGYMAPEQLAGQPVDRRADIYSAGVVLWEALCGVRMWKDVQAPEAMTRVIQGKIPRPREVNPSVSPELDDICMRALSLAPGDRFPSAAAFEAEIDQCLSKLLNRPSDRDVGTMLAQAFAQERANISSLIEAELSAPKSGRAALPVLPIASATNVSPGPPVPTSSPDSSSLEDPVRAGANVGITNPPARVGRRGVVIGGSVAAAFVVGGLVWAIASGRGSAPATAVPSATTLAPLVEGAPTVRGVTDGEILMGMSAAFSGPSRDLGTRMKLGIDTAFSDENDRGGILGRKLTLVALDDGYEGKRALDNMHELVEKRGVFAFIGNVGTPTAQQTVPYANSIKTLFFGAFTGASLLRQQPPDRYVFNYRASYEEETSKMVQYLAAAKHIGPEAVVVFAQHDAYGDAGFNGVAKAMRKLGRADVDILRVNYERNTVDVDAAVSDVMKYHNAADVIRIGNSDVSKPKHPVQAIIMIASYKAAAKFIQKIRDRRISPIFANVSFVGSTALAEELKEQGKNYGAGVIVTQVVPHYESGGSSIIRYREALAKFSPDQQPDFISLEGFVVGKLFAEAVKRAGHDLNEEKVVDTLEAMKEVDLGVGTPLTFGPSEHQASHAVWGTVLDDQMHFLPLDMD